MTSVKGFAIVLAIAFLPQGTLPCAAAVDDSAFQQHTAMITVQRDGMAPNYGVGIILCEQVQSIFILTAWHVLYGPPSCGNEMMSALPPPYRSIDISFFHSVQRFHDPDDTGKAWEKWPPPQSFCPPDLLILVIPAPTLPFPAAPVTFSRANGSESDQSVRSVGFPGGAKPWDVKSGRVFRTSSDLMYLYHDTELAEGFSGGPLFNDEGDVVAVNVKDHVIGSTLGVEDSRFYAGAITTEQVMEAYAERLGSCLKIRGPRASVDEIYLRGLEAEGKEKWQEVERLMKEALMLEPQEGREIQVTSGEQVTYLPHYHRGLSLFNLERWAEALEEWSSSENYQVVKKHKKCYSNLKQLREKCKNRLGKVSK